MNLTDYIDSLHRELAVAAEAGGEDARALAERLIRPLESATRLVLLEALSAAADEITRDLAPGSVEVRLRGREPDFIVTPPPVDQSPEPAPVAAGEMGARASAVPDTDEGGTSRITLRLPEHLKPRIDEAAARMGLSVNAWLVRAVTTVLEPDDQSRRDRGQQFGRRHTGWVR